MREEQSKLLNYHIPSKIIDINRIVALEKENAELKASLKWEQDITSELAEHLGKANDKNAELEEKLANADYQLEGRDLEIKELKAQIEELKEFYENEYFQISDRTANEKIKELEKHQVEITIDEYSSYDPNSWGDMHEEWFVPKEEVRDLLKENYALITKAKELIKKLKALYFSPIVTNDDIKQQDEILDKVEQFLNNEVNNALS